MARLMDAAILPSARLNCSALCRARANSVYSSASLSAFALQAISHLAGFFRQRGQGVFCPSALISTTP